MLQSAKQEARTFLRWLEDKRQDPDSLTPEALERFFKQLDCHPQRLSRTLLRKAYQEGRAFGDEEVEPKEDLYELADIVLDVAPPKPWELC